MPSLRHPVGPLPASIYWRRRVVVLAGLLVAAGPMVWLVSAPGAVSGRPISQDRASQPGPARSIDPGATPTGPAINSRPGGPGPSGSPAPGGTGTPGGEVSLSPGGGGQGGGSPTTDSGGNGAGSGGAPAVNTPAVMALQVCAASQVTLGLAGTQSSFGPNERPRLALTVRNSSGTNCRVDLGRTASTIVVTSTANERIWSSGDCPADRQSLWAQLGAGSGLTETFGWDRNRSQPNCATPDAGTAPAGNYLVQAFLNVPSGSPISARTSIRLDIPGS